MGLSGSNGMRNDPSVRITASSMATNTPPTMSGTLRGRRLRPGSRGGTGAALEVRASGGGMPGAVIEELLPG